MSGEEAKPSNGSSTNGSGAAKKHGHHKRRKKQQHAVPVKEETSTNGNDLIPNVEIEYVTEKPADLDPDLGEVYDRLSKLRPEGADQTSVSSAIVNPEAAVDNLLDSLAEELEKDQSKKALKKRTRPTVAQLKQLVSRPAVVEIHDVTSPDAELLVFLKARRNAVQVPRHWPTPNRFLASKRASDKKPYQLPEYIANTGIGKLRESTDDSNDNLQKRQHNLARPKLSRGEIDYQVLYDAFFKYQTKPRLTKHGELYFEGKEQEKDYSKYLPGVLSEELRQALGMPVAGRDGVSQQQADTTPPPWIYSMQRIGPPPSYPMIKYPGVNAPLPQGAVYGTGPGQWGKPPLDQFGRGIWGDVMGAALEIKPVANEKVKLWGDFVSNDVEDDNRKRVRYESEEEVEEEEEEQPPVTNKKDDHNIKSIEIFSLPKQEQQLVPDEAIDLRKKPTQAHRVLEKQQVSVTSSSAGAVLAAGHKYAIQPSEAVVSIAPEQLESGIDDKQVAKLYEEEKQRTKIGFGAAPGAGHVDLSEIEQQMAKKIAKDKEKKIKKKDFKF